MPGTVGVKDLSVSRSAASGWGTATSGQVYSITTGTAAEFNVTAGVGNMLHNAVNTRHQVELPWGTADFDETITVTSAVVATGSAIEADLVGRQVDASNYFYCGVLLGLSGVLTAAIGQRVGGTNTLLSTYSTGLTYGASTPVRFRAAGVTVNGVGIRLFVKVWLPATQTEPTVWTGVFLQSFATVNSGGILGNGKIGVQSALSLGNTNTTPVTLAFTNYQTTSVGVPYPLTTEGLCADPSSTTNPRQVELAATALALDTYAAGTVDPLVAQAVTRPFVMISSNNQTIDTSGLRSVPFDTLDMNQGTPTNLATANGLVLGPGVWQIEAEEVLPIGTTVTEAQFQFATGGGYTQPSGINQVSIAQRATTTTGSSMQLSGMLTVSSGTSLVGLIILRSDAGGAFTYTRIQLAAYKIAIL